VVNGRTYSVYMLNNDPVRGNKQANLMDSSFRLFESIWGAYPFNHYAIVVTSQPGWPGALEAYTFTTYGETMPLPNANPHEWGHTWWGGFVPCTYLQDIWNESFASYSESVFARHGSDQPASPEVRDRMLWTRSFTSLDQMVNQIPMSQSADALYGLSAAAGYVKGTLVMQNLEETLGFDTLQRCMLEYRREFDGSERAAAWPDFERTVDRVTGQDYTWWFDQWVRRAGLPKIWLDKVTSQPNGSQFQVEGDIVQSTPAYRLNVPVELFTATGEPVKTTVEITGERTHFTLTADSAPQKLNIDPEIRLPRTVTASEGQSLQLTFQNCVVVTGAGSNAAASAISNFGVATKRDTAATPAAIAGKDLILVGSAATNTLWKRYEAACPFTVEGGVINWHGKSYPGDGAIAITANPDDPKRRIAWVATNQADGVVSQITTGARMAILDAGGHLVDGEPGVVGAGPTVHLF
jgi:aminopeptidase N